MAGVAAPFQLGFLKARLGSETTGVILLTAVLVLAAPATSRILPIPLSIVIMAALVVLLVVYHLTTVSGVTTPAGSRVLA